MRHSLTKGRAARNRVLGIVHSTDSHGWLTLFVMGEQSAARLAGDDYQHLYSWFELLQLLPLDSPYSHGFVEHPHAGSADDVTLHPRDRTRAAKYVQVKFHVDHRAAYSGEKLVETH